MRGPIDVLMNCREATHELSRSMDAPLPRGRRLALRLHVFLCVSCQRMERQLRMLRQFARGLAEAEEGMPAQLSDESKARMKRRLAGEGENGKSV